MAEASERSARHRIEHASWGWSWRRAAAGAILLVMIGWAAISAVTPHLRIAEASPANPTVEVRRPVGPMDTPVVLAVLLTVGLMLPDIAEFRIGPDGAAVKSRERGKDTVPPDEDVRDDAQQLDPKSQEFQQFLLDLARNYGQEGERQ